ncbi:MAG TPA: mevalonate kinase, partial [Roseiflexaceae bacterium]
MTEATAPGKIILCGEHAVVYGRPAIALPLADLRARVVVEPGDAGSGITIDAPDLERRWTLASAPDHPLSQLIVGVLDHLGRGAQSDVPAPALQICITSTIPIAEGMGSGAAVATALVRALAAHLGHELPAEAVSTLVYTSERRFHGTPSGIDNSVIAFERPIWFVRRPYGHDISSSGHDISCPDDAAIQNLIEPVTIAAPFRLLIGDTGVRSLTHLPVGEVRQRWQAETAHYESLFDAIAACVIRARATLVQGDIRALGALLNENQALLEQIGVSSDDLDRLVAAARAAGALGAKLSGAGWGGVMIALVMPADGERVAAALVEAGAARVLETAVERH